jgi:pyruvate dehydrogenase E2 component (dihydrolipoamide acetyltransferase)
VTDFALPSLGADMDEGTVVEWLVKPGDTVSRGDIIALVETEKGVIEVEVWEDATIDELTVPEGTKVAVGTTIARLAAVGELVGAVAAEPAREAVTPEALTPEAVTLAPEAPPPAPPVTPPIRHLARELHVDLEEITGSGPGGAVTREDVRRLARPAAAGPAGGRLRVSPYARKRAAELGLDLRRLAAGAPDRPISARDVEQAEQPPSERAAAPIEAPGTGRPAVKQAKEKAAEQAAAMRHAIAQVMAKSKREIPHYYLATTIDLGRALSWLEEQNAERPVAERILPAVLLLKASALAIAEVPEMNGFYVDGEYRPSDAVHLGVAISLRKGGLIAPAIHDADRMTLDELMAALRDLVARTRGGRLRGSEMSDPTITITNLGDRGVESVFPVIYAPQVAIVGFGRVIEKPVVRDGMMGIHPTVQATLAADHRVSDGHRGGLYVAAIERWLQKPEEL